VLLEASSLKEGHRVSQIDYIKLREEIDSVSPGGMAGVLKKAGFVHVGIDPELHQREPESEAQRITWAALDTAWNLLRETAVRLALLELREQLTAQGFTDMPTDEDLFELAREEGEGATSYLDLAPQLGDDELVDIAGEGPYQVLEVLHEVAFAQASEGLGLALEEG